MKKLLFINGCIRKDSRTERLCRRYLAQLDDTCEISEIRVSDLKLQPFDEQMLEKRMEDIQTGNTNKDEYRMAKQFAAADFIVIAAPYWDASFPSVLKVYLEHICVNTITFSYGSGGKPVKLCRANRLVYITTAGGNIKEDSGVQVFWEELCSMFCIDEFLFYCAQGLDICPEKAEEILENEFQEMLRQ